MPLTLPDLDDLTFDDLVEEARAMIPHWAPEWTNHNPSDPGITLIELLAYVTELLIYRLNHVSRASRAQFLQLLIGKPLEPDGGDENLSATALERRLQEAIGELHRIGRAVTAADYEELVRGHAAGREERGWRNLRVRCFEQADLSAADSDGYGRPAPGHVSVVVVPAHGPDMNEMESILSDIRRLLEPKRLLTTRLHVVAPRCLWILLKVAIYPQPDTPFEEVRERAATEIQRYLSPYRGGGPAGDGWPFGRTVYLNDLYARIDRVPGVDYVHAIHILSLADTSEALDADRSALGLQIGIRARVGIDARLGSLATAADRSKRLVCERGGRLVAVRLDAWELAGTVRPQVIPGP